MSELLAIIIFPLIKLILATLGVILGRAVLVWMDKNLDFIKKVGSWKDESQALYYGLRILGVFILIGFALS